jgi:hypothetical protein
MRAPFSMQMFVFEFFSAFRSSSFCNFLASFKEGTERPPPGEGIQTHSPSNATNRKKSNRDYFLIERALQRLPVIYLFLTRTRAREKRIRSWAKEKSLESASRLNRS